MRDNQPSPRAAASASFFYDPRNGLPALANLSRAAAEAVVAGVLVQGPEEFELLAGAEPATGLPVWIHGEWRPNLVDQISVRLWGGRPGRPDGEWLEGSLSFDAPSPRVSVSRLRSAAARIVSFALDGG
jgi:hypothetical protein